MPTNRPCTHTSRFLKRLINLQQYPLLRPECQMYQSLVDRTQRALDLDGCCILDSFFTQEGLNAVNTESQQLAPKAYYHTQETNVYNTKPNPALPEKHPAHLTMQRGNAFVAKDLFPENSMMKMIHESSEFRYFVADCMRKEMIYIYDDPLAGLVLNVLEPNKQHPWHFDTNEFTVSLMIQRSEKGGVFEYCPNIRTPECESLEAVRSVLLGDRERVIPIDIKPGDLQLFKGRFSLHRVTHVRGKCARYTAIFGYTEQPGYIGKPERTRHLFGRVSSEHIKADTRGIRSDRLID